jgi:alpha-L-fucosidase
MMVDIISKNGNLLLTIAPDGQGAVPPLVVERVTGLGKWLASAGDCIYNTVCAAAAIGSRWEIANADFL